MNWAFNVYPLVCPALCNLYAKIHLADHNCPWATIYINTAISRDLDWGRNHICSLPGIIMLNNLDWFPKDADVTVFTDASFCRLGFWFTNTTDGYFHGLTSDAPDEWITYWEMVAICLAINHVAHMSHHLQLLVYTDNQNTIDFFSLPHILPQYNEILKFPADCLIHQNLQLKVVHIPRAANQVADALF
jgi:hypothetical protein